MNRALWIVQGLLALLFLSAGASKLATPLDELSAQYFALPGPFLRFLGIAEILGSLGLILPGLLRIRPALTPLAATGLLAIMIGAVATSVANAEPTAAPLPLAIGSLAAFVAHGRRRPIPFRKSPRRSALHPAA